VEHPYLMIPRHDEAAASSSHCHKSTQVPTPQLIYFALATRQFVPGFLGFRFSFRGWGICLKYLTGTCAQQFQVPWSYLPFLCHFLLFFVLLLNSQVAFESRILCGLFGCFPFAIFKSAATIRGKFHCQFPYNAQ